MASEPKTDSVVTIPPITSKALVEFVVTEPSERLIDSFIDSLARQTPEALLILVARATPIRKALQYIEKQAEGRIALDRILNFGQEWPDPDTGVIKVFKGDLRERRLSDPAGCREALLKAGAVSRATRA